MFITYFVGALYETHIQRMLYPNLDTAALADIINVSVALLRW